MSAPVYPEMWLNKAAHMAEIVERTKGWTYRDWRDAETPLARTVQKENMMPLCHPGAIHMPLGTMPLQTS
eukprot:1138986-Pelagomonas_calceolata.AAC.4